MTVSLVLYNSTTMPNKMLEEKLNGIYTRIAACFFEQILEAACYKTAAIQPLTSDLTNLPSKTNKTWWALLEKQGQAQKCHSSADYFILTQQCWQTSKNLCTSTLCGHWQILYAASKMVRVSQENLYYQHEIFSQSTLGSSTYIAWCRVLLLYVGSSSRHPFNPGQHYLSNHFM